MTIPTVKGVALGPSTSVTCAVGAMVMPIFQMRKPRHREGKVTQPPSGRGGVLTGQKAPGLQGLLC